MSDGDGDNSTEQLRRFSEGLAALLMPLMHGAAALAKAAQPVAEAVLPALAQIQARARAWLEEEARKSGVTPEELLRSWAQTIQRLTPPPTDTLPAYTLPLPEPMIYVPSPNARHYVPSGDSDEDGDVNEPPAQPYRKVGFKLSDEEG